MENEIICKGKCIYCNEMVLKENITKHFKTHLTKIENENQQPESTAFHLKIESEGMFLHVLIKGDSSLMVLDTFLRKIWLECCGHMSSFFLNNSEINMREKIKNILKPKAKYIYRYDFGSTTTVFIQVAGIYNIKMSKNVVLLSRNEPLNILCSKCHIKPAISVCVIHLMNYNDGYYCSDCITEHEKECTDFKDYANMNVVNSPRMGVCGYSGGSIDKERDGIYKIEE